MLVYMNIYEKLGNYVNNAKLCNTSDIISVNLAADLLLKSVLEKVTYFLS